MTGVARILHTVESWFPERHLYLRSAGEMRGFVLTPVKQMIAVGVAAGFGLWLLGSTAITAFNAVSLSRADRQISQMKVENAQLNAAREAQINQTLAQIAATNGSVNELASAVEKRHQALALLIAGMRGESKSSARLRPAAEISAEERLRATQQDQERLVAQTELYAKARADKLRKAFRMVGVNPNAYARRGMGGPLISLNDPRAVAAKLDVDPQFASRMASAASNMTEMRALAVAAQRLPLARPTRVAFRSSSYGVRFDPFTHRPAFHSGLDFPGGMGTPITASGDGVVAFTGRRNGYGTTVEVRHDGGFMTRYGHLSRINVRPGQRVMAGQQIAAMGSTGRSTGPHLHYEVWANGRVQNPDRYMKAGDHVQQAIR